MLEQSQIEAIIAKLRERFDDLVVDTRDYGRTTGVTRRGAVYAYSVVRCSRVYHPSKVDERGEPIVVAVTTVPCVRPVCTKPRR